MEKIGEDKQIMQTLMDQIGLQRAQIVDELRNRF
jgi:hypothetical protein